MKLSALTKPTEVNIDDLPLQPERGIVIHDRRFNTTPLPNDDPSVEVDDDDDIPFEQQLVVAVDYIRRMQNFLAFIHENNSQHAWLGEKSSTNLQDLVEEVEDFLGEYAT